MKCLTVLLVLSALLVAPPFHTFAEPTPAPVVYESVSVSSQSFHVVHVDLARADLQLFWKDDDKAIRSLRGLEQHLKRNGQTLLFATNAGIYSKDFTPAGLHVEHGEELHKINLRDGRGNFHLMPNGVFYVDDTGAHIVESRAYIEAAPAPRIATQSGPMLVSKGAIHPKFKADSASAYIRSGVGVLSPTQIVFAISEAPVNFHTFASLFRDQLRCPDALYLDGQISRFYMPGILEDSGPALYVGMLAVVPRAPETAVTPQN